MWIKAKIILSCVSVLLVFSSCKVYENFSETSYLPKEQLLVHSFAWIYDTIDDFPATTKSYKKHLEKGLLRKGFVKDTLNPDMFLKLSVRNWIVEDFIFFPPGVWPRDGVRVIEYVNSSVILLVSDKEKNPAWNCKMEGNIYKARQEKRAVRAVAKGMLKKFPFQNINSGSKEIHLTVKDDL
jgi:hypothetical protein